MKSRSGISNLLFIMFLYFFFIVAMISFHFAHQRRKGIQNFERAQRKLESLHRKNAKGEHSWSEVFDDGTDEALKAEKITGNFEVSKNKGRIEHEIFIDFGR